MNNTELVQLTKHTRVAVQKAADFIRGEAGKVQPGQIEEKFLNGLVSYVDRGAEEILVEALGLLLPEAAFLTEEETVAQTNAPLQWIIDPLDGTTNFLFNLPHYAVSVGLRSGNDLLVGVVQHVPLNQQYYAWAGGGAFCDERPIRVSERASMSGCLVATGFPYNAFDRADDYFGALKAFTNESRGVRRFGAAALDLAYVATGQYDMFFEYGLSPWDIAGGALLVQEAGGQVGDFGSGKDYLFDGELVAANGLIFEHAQEVLHKHFKKR
ncbi:MAG: inositol monophosphatase family protein [Saprospiraceae bacterium]